MDKDVVYPAVRTNSPTHQSFSLLRPANRRFGPVNSRDDVINDEERPRNVPVYLAVCLFGLSGTMPTKALWIELPSLTKKLPEGKMLSLYLLIILESANLAALAYILAKKLSRNRLSEIPFIYSCFALGIISLVLAGVFWDNTTPILGNQNSFALLLSTFIAAIVSCVSIVTYIPFTARLREKYITAVFLGEVLGSMIPQLLSIAQGINRKYECGKDDLTPPGQVLAMTISNDSNLANQSDDSIHYEERSAQGNPLANPRISHLYPITPKTIIGQDRMQPLRFNENAYFLICAGLLGTSALCFILVRWCSLCTFEYAEVMTDHMDHELDVNPGDADDEVWQSTHEGCRTLDDGSIRQDGSFFKYIRRNPDHSVGYQKTEVSMDHENARVPYQDDSAAERNHVPNLDVQDSVELNTSYQSDNPISNNTNCIKHEVTVHKPHSPARYRIRSDTSNSPVDRNVHKVPHLLPLSRISTSSEATKASTIDAATGRPRSFPLLLVITFWTTGVLSGPLSTEKAYACFPAGNTRFLMGTVLCDVFVVLTCIAAARMQNKAQVTMVIALTCLGTIMLTYFVALMAFSHESDSREESPLLGSGGEMLAAIAWTAVTAVFSYARVSVAVTCRHAGIEAITWYSYVTLAGSALGTVAFVDNISICQVFKPGTCIAPVS